MMSAKCKLQGVGGSVKIHNPELYSELLGKAPKQEEEDVDHNKVQTLY